VQKYCFFFETPNLFVFSLTKKRFLSFFSLIMKKVGKKFGGSKKMPYLCTRFGRKGA